MQFLKGNKGITIIALLITIIVMTILVTISVKFGTQAIEKSAEEDIKNNMLLIQGRAKIIKDKHIYDEANSPLVGTAIANATSFVIPAELQSTLNALVDAQLYILSQEDLSNNGLGNISINSTKFYIIDYNTCEVYYSLGNNGRYSLT